MNPVLQFTPQSFEDSDIRHRVQALVDGISFDEVNKRFKRIEILLRAPASEPKPVKALHVWNAGAVDAVNTPAGLPRLPVDAICPVGHLVVEVSFISRLSGGMGSYYQFDGYYLSLILSPDGTRILDARGERAS